MMAVYTFCMWTLVLVLSQLEPYPMEAMYIYTEVPMNLYTRYGASTPVVLASSHHT